jgi:hypothetical protein
MKSNIIPLIKKLRTTFYIYYSFILLNREIIYVFFKENTLKTTFFTKNHTFSGKFFKFFLSLLENSLI